MYRYKIFLIGVLIVIQASLIYVHVFFVYLELVINTPVFVAEYGNHQLSVLRSSVIFDGVPISVFLATVSLACGFVVYKLAIRVMPFIFFTIVSSAFIASTRLIAEIAIRG